MRNDHDRRAGCLRQKRVHGGGRLVATVLYHGGGDHVEKDDTAVDAKS